MKHPNVLSNLSSSALLELLGLQSKPSVSHRVLTHGGFLLAGLVVGGAAALLLAPKSGRALRGDIESGARQLSESVSTTAGQAIEGAQRKVADLRNHSEKNAV